VLERKTMRKKLVCVAVIGLFETSFALANVRLPKLIGDNMVLQRDTKITLWGWAEPGEKVTIYFHGDKLKAKTDKNGRWTTSAGPFAAGGPFGVVVAGKNQLELHDILIGDVWLASGQSNMSVSLGPEAIGEWKGVNNTAMEVAGAHFPQIRLFKVDNNIALQPIADAEAATWTPVTPASVRSFSAVAYLFGRELYQRYHVPIGLIESSWGGTVAEAWVSETSLKQFPDFQPAIVSLNNIDEKSAVVQHQKYLKNKSEWYTLHGAEDRGRGDGGDLWAAPSLNTASWPTIDEPQTKEIEALSGFDGVVWFRREIVVPGERAGKDAFLHLPGAYRHDITFFNGMKIGETEGGDKPKEYLVPGSLVRTGRNVIVLRLTGADGFVGLYGEADELNFGDGDQTVALAGKWCYQTGPDLDALPKPSAYSKLESDKNTATLLFNGMIAPLVHYRIRGVIWYQGEANALDNRSVQYRSLFPALIQDWRQQWGYEIPFLFVQLAGWPSLADPAEPAESTFAELREAQSMSLSLPATAMATAVDQPAIEQPAGHPRDKQTVAHRLVLAAAKTVYGEHLVYSGPVYQSMTAEGNRIRIKFSQLGSGLLIKDKYGYIRGFEIAGSDGKFVWAQAVKDGDDIIVFNEAVRRPSAVRYDWSNTPDGNLFNEEGLPALPFRTDSPE
jgi:sialate O-acetylesterase